MTKISIVERAAGSDALLKLRRACHALSLGTVLAVALSVPSWADTEENVF